MSESKSLSETLKDALAKKHAVAHPDAKKASTNSKKPGGNAPKGPPMRKAASRGG